MSKIREKSKLVRARCVEASYVRASVRAFEASNVKAFEWADNAGCVYEKAFEWAANAGCVYDD
jgi:hypothetical protein